MDTKEQRMVEGAEHTDAVLGRVLRQRERLLIWAVVTVAVWMLVW